MAPLCKCHGEAMLWGKDARYSAGGFWRCRVKNRERGRRWETTETRWRRYIKWERPRALLAQRAAVAAELERLEAGR